jgi:DNA-binding transcriptional regulator LsrR (DeoR family)
VELGLFAGKRTIRVLDVAKELGLSERKARNLLTGWVEDGWLKIRNTFRRARADSLSAKYRKYIGSSSAMPR